MESVAGSTESQVPLQQVSCVGCSGHLKSGGKPEPPRNCRKCNYYKKHTVVLAVALAVVSLGLIIATTVLAVLLFMRSWDGRATSAGPSPGPPLVPCQGPPSVPCCLEGWVGYRGKCYYFSKEEKNWDSSQHFCSSFNASLAVIDTQQEKDFMMRYAALVEHWIGLRRESGQPWKWVNGTIFSQQLFEVRAEGDCAYLSDIFVSSSRCYSLRNWICSKPDAHTKGKEHKMEGD
ncbi:C-type lectin domain family 2 member D-like [Mauremys reevesii]|uniref:C-type lectin domain family 2 member D-like n=1 Tax=Mauremys reevesii TaxID=260615 RepID=UPI00193F39D6|nr:C-type lectin domain family 2 member D-like [Mauremys reevesii]XP_039373260.1 C-type lectin domain family 2 member D-like [Mauremys reevesii]